jgi:hypothetical protein
MTSLIERPPSPERRREGDMLARAWYALLLLPVSFFAAFALAQVLYTAVGHDPSTETPPHWADAVALVPAGLVFIVPAVFSLVYAHRAVKAGQRTGYVPAAIAIAAVVGYTILCIV